MVNKKKGYKELTPEHRRSIFCMLFGMCKDDKITRKQFVSVASSFQVGEATIRRVWRQSLENMEAHLLKQAESLNTIKKLHLFWTRTLPLKLFLDHVYESKKKGLVGKKGSMIKFLRLWRELSAYLLTVAEPKGLSSLGSF